MNYFKEYGDSQKKICRWLPWACLVSPDAVENKDGSFVGAFEYTEKNGDNQNVIKSARELPLLFGSGWVWWAERRYAQGSYINNIALCWNPRVESGGLVNYPKELDLPKDISSPQTAFMHTLNYLETALSNLTDIKRLRDLSLLQFLHDAVTPDSGDIVLPEIPLYLDALLSQDSFYSISNSGLSINGKHLKIISLLGFTAGGGALFTFLEKRRYKYRFVRRFVFFSMDDARKEARRYMTGWCEGRKSVLTALDFSYSPDKARGLLANTLIVWHEDMETLLEICGEIRSYLDKEGIMSTIEEANQVDVWLGSLPAMFRCNIAPPLVEFDNPALLFL
jgi:hypothetical protein